MAQNIDVSIIPQSYLPEIKVSENDDSLRVIRVSIIDENGEAYQIPSGVTATFAGTKPSGLGFTVPCTIDGSAVQFTMENTVCNEQGRFPAEIRLINGEARIGTCNVLMSVEPNPHPDDTTDGDREPLVNEITALLHAIEEQAEQVAEDARIVEQAMDAWTNMSAEAETLPAGSDATASYSEGVLSLGIPRGDRGEDGQDGQDGVGIASVQLNSDYTLTITLTDGRTYTTTSIRGEQGETGLTPDFTIGTVTTLAPGSQATATITGTDEEPVLNLGIPKGDPGEVTEAELLKLAVHDEASGSIASFADGSDGFPMDSLKVTLEPKQAGSGDPSPDNVRPITGWDEVNTVVCGKNLFDEADATIYRRYFQDLGNTHVWTSDSGSGSFAFPCKPNTTYTVSCDNSSVVLFRVGYIDVDPDVLASSDSPTLYGVIKKTASGNTTITTGADAKAVVVQVNNAIVTARTAKIQIELGSTATDYEPYQGRTITTDLPQTVYGGTLDVVTGELVVDRVMDTYNGSEAWAKDSDLTGGIHRFYLQNDTIKKYSDYTNVLLSNKCKATVNYQSASTMDGDFAVTAYNITINLFNWAYIFSKTIDTVNGIKAWLADEPLQFCYELATPTTTQLTPTEVDSLLGTNNVWSDGDVYVKYVADTKLYILKVTQ